MTPDEALSAAVKRRLEERGISLADLTRLTGVSYPTWRDLRDRGELPTRMLKRNALAAGLGWTPDSFDRVRSGGDPLETEGASAPGSESLDDLREAVRAVAESLGGLGRRVDDLAQETRSLREEVHSLSRGRPGSRSASNTPQATS